MPYIKQEKRRKLANLYKEFVSFGIKADGDLNYILFKYCKNYIVPSYNNYKNYCGELRQCATEIERRLLAYYENDKIQTNGDVT